MGKQGSLLRGLLLGAGAMYLLDRQQGRRRRALVRDQIRHAASELGDMMDTAGRDFSQRARGLVAETRNRFGGGEASAPVLEARIRSEIGRTVSHPGSIEVRVEDGTVILSGPILAAEVDDLISTAESVPGVQEVVHRLEVHEEPGNVPGLQGPGRRQGRKPEILQENWTPSLRLAAGVLGGATALYGARTRGARGTLLATLGLGLLARALTNLDFRRLTGINAGRKAVDIQKTINVNAPIDEVFEFWSHFENFPRFMSHLKEVTRGAEGRSHWVAAGPAGIPVEWDAVTTRFVPNEEIAWKSVEGSTIGNAGIVRFQENPDATTRVDVQMTYNPVAGALGHAVASLFGADPRHAMHEDLVRSKSLIEEGKTSADGETVTREELAAAREVSEALYGTPREGGRVM